MSGLRFMRNFLALDEVDLTASTEDTEFPVSNLKEQLRSKVWRTTSPAAQYVVIDLQTAEDVDSVAVLFRKNQPIKLTGGATIKIEANPTANFATPLLSQTLTLDSENEVITHFFSTVQSYRYWRLYIDDPGNPYGHLEVSNIVLSSSTNFQCSVGVGFKYRIQDASRAQESDGGQKYFDIKPSTKLLQFEVPIMDYADAETLLELFEQVGSTEAIGVDIDSLGESFDKDRFFVYGTLQRQYETVHTRGNYFTQEFTVEELL